MKVIELNGVVYTELEARLQNQVGLDLNKHFVETLYKDTPYLIQYSWKGGDWTDLRSYPSSSVEWELDKFERLYSYEYKFRMLEIMTSAKPYNYEY